MIKAGVFGKGLASTVDPKQLGFAAAVLNPHFGMVFLPTGKPLGIFK